MDIWIRLARSRLLDRFIPRIFTHMSCLIPVKRLFETRTLMAFQHPKPAYPLHILIVPKRAISGPASISAKDQDFLFDLFQCVAKLVEEFRLEDQGYRLITNGGKYQEVPQLHFHLISEKTAPELSQPS